MHIKKFTAGLVALGTALALTACGGEEAGGGGGETQEITVGVIPIVDVAPLYLGVEQGFFEEQGLDVKLESGQGGAAIVPGVVSGQFDFGFSNVTSLILARSEGLPLKIVAAGNYSTGEEFKDFSGVVVPAGSPIKDAAGLAGKTVAVNTLNNVGDTTVRQSVEKAGGDPASVEFTELAFPDMPAALSNGQVDAAWLVEPFRTIALQQGGKEIASNLVDTMDNLMIAAYFANEKVDSDLQERFTTAMKKPLDYAAENPDAVRKILNSYTEIDPAVAEAMVLPRFSSEVSTETVETLAQLAEEGGLVDEPVDTDALLP
jgi:NitT/TauT family transport system substrate-binding protein